MKPTLNSISIQQSILESTQTTSISNFIPLQKIGQGSFSSVYKVRRITDDQVYALKKVKIAALKEKEKQNALNEIRILASLNSEYVVQYRQAFFDHKLNLLCIVMEYANEGDLQKKIETYKKSSTHTPQNQVWKAAYHTLQGLDILHSKSILHRDIKSANIFINNGVYKLGDLNVSKIQDSIDKLAYTQTGTPYYASPEVWRDQPYDSKSDIWSLGCVLYEMCTSRPPFKGKDLETLFHNVQKGYYDPLPIQYSEQLSDFIGYCLKMKPKKRLSCKQLLNTREMKIRCLNLGLSYQINDTSDELLKTIQLPSDLKDLRKKLPKSKYSCSIDNLESKKLLKEIPIKSSQNIGANQANSDYFLQLANKKKQSKTNYIKLNRVISEGSANYRNPEQESNLQNSKSNKDQNKSQRVLENERNYERVINQEKQKQIIAKELSPRSSRSKKNSPSSKISELIKLKAQIAQSKRKFETDLENEKRRIRKLSHDRSPRETKGELNSIYLIKKLSQPTSSMGKCLSQRYIYNDIQMMKEKSNEIETERLCRGEKMSKNVLSLCKNDELAQIEKKVEEKRKLLRKIGSIQRLNGSSHKNNANLSYRPTPLIMHPTIKRSAMHLSNILLKSPTSTQDQSSNFKLKQKASSSKKIAPQSQLQKVSSTPYMIGLLDAPRMKTIVENLQESKRVKEPEIKNKILSGRYVHKN